MAMSTEFTLEQFRAACVITPDPNCRGILSGSRAIDGQRITWHSAHGEHYAQCSTGSAADPVAALYYELQKNLIIRNCMTPETPTMKAAREAEERRAKIVTLARENLEKEGELEISPDAEISDGDDNGCYVAAWVWMPFDGTEFDKKEGT